MIPRFADGCMNRMGIVTYLNSANHVPYYNVLFVPSYTQPPSKKDNNKNERKMVQFVLMSFLLYIKALILNSMIYACAKGNSVIPPLLKELKECPMSEASWTRRSRELCNNTKDKFYHCLPTNYLNASVEGCFELQTIQPGYCAIYNIHLKKVYIDDDSSCEGKTTFNCPIHAYFSNETYRYPSCQKINPVKSCYLVDPTCPSVTR